MRGARWQEAGVMKGADLLWPSPRLGQAMLKQAWCTTHINLHVQDVCDLGHAKPSGNNVVQEASVHIFLFQGCYGVIIIMRYRLLITEFVTAATLKMYGLQLAKLNFFLNALWGPRINQVEYVISKWPAVWYILTDNETQMTMCIERGETTPRVW